MLNLVFYIFNALEPIESTHDTFYEFMERALLWRATSLSFTILSVFHSCNNLKPTPIF